MEEPPSEVGGFQFTVNCPFADPNWPAVKVTLRGAPGTSAVVTVELAVEAGDTPAALVAVTVKV